MKTVSKKDITLFLMLLLVWAVVIFISPLVTYLATRNLETASTMLRMMCGMLWFPFLLFFLNFYVFWRFLFCPSTLPALRTGQSPAARYYQLRLILRMDPS